MGRRALDDDAKEARRNQILDAAEKVAFTNGEAGASVDAVAAAAGVSKGLVYLYYSSKQELLRGLTLRGIEELHRRITGAAECCQLGLEKYRAIGEAYLRFSQELPGYFQAIAHFQSVRHDPDELGDVEAECIERLDEILDLAIAVVELGQRDGSIRRDVPPRMIAVAVVAQMHGVIQLAQLGGAGPGKHALAPADLFAVFLWTIGQALLPGRRGDEGDTELDSWQQFAASMREQLPAE